jgi:hypothetical protein
MAVSFDSPLTNLRGLCKVVFFRGSEFSSRHCTEHHGRANDNGFAPVRARVSGLHHYTVICRHCQCADAPRSRNLQRRILSLRARLLYSRARQSKPL